MAKRVDLSLYPTEPNYTGTTSCGATYSVFIPIGKTKESYIPILEDGNKRLQQKLYEDIYTGKRTVDEIVSQIREHIPDYEPRMIPWDDVFGE